MGWFGTFIELVDCPPGRADVLVVGPAVERAGIDIALEHIHERKLPGTVFWAVEYDGKALIYESVAGHCRHRTGAE